MQSIHLPVRRRKRKKSMLTVLGIAIGVYSVLVIAIIGLSGKTLLDKELNKLGFNCITISASDKQLSCLSTADIDYLQELPGVDVAAPLVVNMGQVGTRGFVGDAVVCGIDKSTSQVVQISLLYGRMFTKGEISTGSRVCIVDESLAKAFYKRSNIIGKTLSIKLGEQEESFTIIGISGSGSGMLTNIVGDYVPSFVYLPYTTQMASTGRTAIDQLFVQLDGSEDFDSFGTTVSEALSRRAGYLNLYRHSNLATQKDKLSNILSLVTLLLMAIGAISFVVSGLSIMTIMLSSVKERTREIGIKKAIGAGRFDIMADFLSDALWLSFSGCVLGLAAVMVTVIAIGLLTGIHPTLPLSVIGGIFLFSVAIGVIFGVYPALVAAAMNPVDALRQDN